MTNPVGLPSRRQFLGAAAAMGGVAAVAGCIAGVDPEGVPQRPDYGADPSQLDAVLRFLVLSVHYQNLYFDHGAGGMDDVSRPEFTGNPSDYDRELRFIIQSMIYQNRYIEAEAE